MLNCCSSGIAELPEIVIYTNCDTVLAINLQPFNLNDYDELVFAIKNYDYIDSSYVFLRRARKIDMDENGEVIFKIDPDTSKLIKPGAFYNFSLLINAHNKYKPTEYKKLTKNGTIRIEYGAHDLLIAGPEVPASTFSEVLSAHIEEIREDEVINNNVNGAIVKLDLEEIT
jgi:hypothetical protein